MTPQKAYELSVNYPFKFSEKKDYYESILATSPEYASVYSSFIIYDRFEKGEKAIATDFYHSYWYANKILKGRFELGEYSISRSRYYFEKYMNDISNKTHIYYKFI